MNDPFLALLDTIGTPVLVIDLDGRVIFLNEAFRSLDGAFQEGASAQTIWNLLRMEQDRLRVQAALSRGEFEAGEYDFALDGGRACLMRCTGKMLPSGKAWVITAQDLTQPKQADEGPAKNLIQYKTVVETMHDALNIIDEEGRITYVNSTFCTLTGRTQEDLLKMRLEDLLDEENRAILVGQLEKRRLGENATYEMTLIHHDGHRIETLVSAAPLYDDSGRYTGSFGVLTDISQFKAMERELIHSNAELDAFAHTVAHDLKNPIAVLMGFIMLLQSDFRKMNETELRDYLLTIERTGDKMINIIDELLLLSEMRHVDVKMRPVSNIDVVTEAVRRLNFMIDQYQAQVTPIDYDLWPEALGHAAWVEEVWVNYISNAIKYGGHPPVVELNAEKLADGRVRFMVRDNGKGIPPEKQSRLFTPFTRLDQVRAEGHGLGLSIVHRIVEKLGGEVGVESSIGKGSVFSFILPAA